MINHIEKPQGIFSTGHSYSFEEPTKTTNNSNTCLDKKNNIHTDPSKNQLNQDCLITRPYFYPP